MFDHAHNLQGMFAVMWTWAQGRALIPCVLYNPEQPNQTGCGHGLLLKSSILQKKEMSLFFI